MTRLLRCACVRLALASLVVAGPVLAQPAATGKGRAYIWVGDINPPWYSLMIRSAYGQVDPYAELKPVIDAQRQRMEKMGYTVTLVDVASAHEIEKAIKDPQTKAFAFFGHGDEKVGGTISTLSGEDITAGDIQGWAGEAATKRLGTPESWRKLSKVERTRRYEAVKNAHFDMQYVYMHSCYSLKDKSLVDALMAQGGEYRGYRGKAYLKDDAESALRSSDFNTTDAAGKPLAAPSTTNGRWVLTTKPPFAKAFNPGAIKSVTQGVDGFRGVFYSLGKERELWGNFIPPPAVLEEGDMLRVAVSTNYDMNLTLNTYRNPTTWRAMNPGELSETVSMVHEVRMPFWESNRSYLTVGVDVEVSVASDWYGIWQYVYTWVPPKN